MSLRKFVQWMFPQTVNEIEESVHSLYRSVGVELEYVVPQMKLATSPLIEGEVPEDYRMHMIARVKIGELKEVQIW
jgi:hypothetical protein